MARLSSQSNPDPTSAIVPHRRSVLVGGVAAVFGALAGTTALGQRDPNDLKRGAVVIGVDRAGTLQKLSAAASGARDMEGFLRAEGFDVRAHIDDANGGPVKADELFDSVSSLVAPGVLDQLVIFFSGHGFLHGYSEYWMLSGAPENSNETVAVRDSVELARFAGIPNVVFISDACRSVPTSLKLGQIQGGYKIFPSGNAFSNGKIDLFYATSPGAQAYEVNVSTANFKGVFTEAFLHAFRNPYPDMIHTLPNGTRVVPNRLMEDFLIAETQRRAQEANIFLEQVADIRVTSQTDAHYVGRVLELARPPFPVPSPDRVPAATLSPQAALSDIVEATVAAPSKELSDPTPSFARFVSGGAPNLTLNEAETEALSATFRAFADQANADAERPMGIGVRGAAIDAVFVPEGVSVQAREEAFVQLSMDGRTSALVYVQLSGGLGLPLSMFEGLSVTIVTVAGSRFVRDVQYVPSPNSAHFEAYDNVADELRTLRAAMSAAIAQGAFVFGSDESGALGAEALAQRAQELMRFDPSLGIYAAYAFADALRHELIGPLLEANFGNFDAALFDLGLLDGKLRGAKLDLSKSLPDLPRFLPPCPALRPGWELLRANDVSLPEPMASARPHLTESLWTAFEKEGGAQISRAIESGDLQ